VEWGNPSLDANAEEEIGQLKRQLDQAASMIESYEELREEKNEELQRMKVCGHPVHMLSCDVM
jgi:multidrug resistance efflux pump